MDLVGIYDLGCKILGYIRDAGLVLEVKYS
jgi:hypothetical protein